MDVCTDDFAHEFVNCNELENDDMKSLDANKKTKSEASVSDTSSSGILHSNLQDCEDDDLIDLLDSFREDEHNLIASSRILQDGNEPHEEHLAVLQRCFGHKSFRPLQWKIINSIINDRRDNCAIMATGYGKSLCYQYPSVFCGGVTIVISPLISLMEDQVLSLHMSNISACLLGTAQTQQKKVVEDILDDKYSFVYVTPEFCCGDLGQGLLKDIDSKLSITLIAIDEAHCVSTWGHDFRHQYRELGLLRSVLPHVPILAVTATATPRVRSDIVSSLKLRNPQILCSGFDRPNLYFSVFLKSNNGIMADLRKVMIGRNGEWTFEGSTIIYCITRKQTEDVAAILKVQGLKCSAYHAGMNIKQRKETHENFVRDKITVIVATIAFGMGIDKPDVRNIVHYGASRDIESYYQEVGRAGRDGQPAKCTTIYNHTDFNVLRSLRDLGYGSEKTKKQKEAMALLMQKYLEMRTCRRKFILTHFEGQTPDGDQPKPDCCDNCTRKLQQVVPDQYEGLDDQGLFDFTQDAHTFLAAVNAMNGTFGVGTYILFLKGSKSSKVYDRFRKHPLHGSGTHKSEEWWKCIANILERDKYLEKTTMRNAQRFAYSTVSVGKKGERFLKNLIERPKGTKILLEPTPEVFNLLKKKPPPLPKVSLPTVSSSNSRQNGIKESNIQTVSQTACKDEAETEERMRIYRLLLNKRTELAYSFDCMPYMIASNEALMKMAKLKPRNVAELRRCQLEGFTEAKLTKFGEYFVSIICAQYRDSPNGKTSIENVLCINPLPGAKLGPSAEVTYNLYKKGLTIQQIAKERHFVISTVFVHLIDSMKVGKPVKLKDLSVTDDIKNTIINAIRSPPINSDMKALTPIKDQCPPEITFEQIRAVVAYLQVRDHLNQLGCEYHDFEDSQVNNGTVENKKVNSADEGEEINDALCALADEIERNGYMDETFVGEEDIKGNEDLDETFVDEEDIEKNRDLQDNHMKNEGVKEENKNILEPPEKKKKLNRLSLLDSPPRKFT